MNIPSENEMDVDFNIPFDLNASRRDLANGKLIYDYDPEASLEQYRAQKGEIAMPPTAVGRLEFDVYRRRNRIFCFAIQ